MKTKNLKNIVKAINKLKLDKLIIVDMAGVLIKDGYLYARNLEVGMRVKIDWDGEDLFIDNAMWKKLTANFKEFTTDKVEQDKIFLKADGAKISIPRTNLDNYNQGPGSAEAKFVMSATKADIESMIRALGYVSKDELRPAMMQVALNKGHIVATDAHRLLFVKAEGEIERDLLINPELIKMIQDMEWNEARILADKEYVFIHNDGDLVWSRLVDEKYPQWEAVIPQDNSIKVQVDCQKMLEGIKQAMVFANQTTKQVAFNFNGCATIKASDIDFKHEYSKALEGFYQKDGTDIEIGFNGSYLTEVLKDVNCKNVEMQMSRPSTAIVINNEILLMPVMLDANA